MNNFSNFNFSDIWCMRNAKSRSICPENFTGNKGCAAMADPSVGESAARDLGIGWKVSPRVTIQPGETFVMADVKDMGMINHIWLTPTGNKRFSILRIYWDESDVPSVECPVGDFFAAAYDEYHQVSSIPVCANPKSGLNCYWTMPFKKGFKITMENISDEEMVLYYQIDYTLTDIPENAGYFHAQFNRSNPLEYKSVHTVLENVKGKGQYVGTYFAWGVNNNGWWGEGEIKFYIDGDKEFPTICGTGTEDYICGSYNFDAGDGYTEFTTPYTGFAPIKNDNAYASQKRFSMYRWHLTDPVYFEEDLKVTIQALGWRSFGRYLPLQDDISSVAFWYQDKPSSTGKALPDRDYLEII